MPKNPNVKKVMVIGSGPIVIGQAAEFDYAGTQACRSLKEEGVEVVLVNSNPATIMTDKDIADKVYIEPLTVQVLEQIIEKEKPDSILPTLGGQAGLNLGMELDESGFLASHNVKLLGTTSKTIRKAEDRQEFKDTMEKIGEPCAPSLVVTNIEDGVAFASKIGYRWCCDPPIRWAEAAAASPITRWSWRRSWQTACVSPVWARCLWSAASRAGRRSSMR